MPLPKLSDNRSGAIAIQIYTADIKDLIFALNIYELTTLVRDYDKFSVVAVDSLLMDISIYDTDTCKTDTQSCPTFLYSLYLPLSKAGISQRRTLVAGPKGVYLRKS